MEMCMGNGDMGAGEGDEVVDGDGDGDHGMDYLCCTPQVKYGVRSPKFIWAPVYSCTHWLTPPPRIWAHKRGRYWSAKIDDISCVTP